MKIFRPVAIVFLTLIAVIITVILVVPPRLSRRALPDYQEQYSFSNLMDTVRVFRDSRGIPHIYARHEDDLYFLTGYVMAQERMWQMDLLRRVTLGRLSEIFGEDYIEVDLLLRSLRYGEKSENILESGDPDAVKAMNSFSDGVNAYINKQDGKFPLEFTLLGYKPEPWEPEHSLNLIGYMAWDLKSGWSELILEKLRILLDSSRLAEVYPNPDISGIPVFSYMSDSLLLQDNRLTALRKLDELGLDVFDGSNNWAVAGNKSETGKPLLANDMHLGLNVPGIWLQIHQVVEGKLSVSGLALPGQPFVIVGHNDSIAWGMTNTYVDNLDYYEEKIHPDDSNLYLFNGEWRAFDIIEEKIAVKGGDTAIRSYRINHRGPVLSADRRIDKRVLTFRWVGSFPGDEPRSIYKINRAANWEDFKSAFSTFRSISQNIVYADVRGNIGLYSCGGVPVRDRSNRSAVLPGWTDQYEWKGFVPFDELPHKYNPESGYVASANNRTVGPDYPYHIGTWAANSYRIDRIWEMLRAKEKLSVKDFQVMQLDQKSELAELMIGALLPVLKTRTSGDELQDEALQLLENWVFEMHDSLPQPLILETWSYYFIQEVMEDELGKELFADYLDVYRLPRIALHNLLQNPESDWYDNVHTDEKESLADAAWSSFGLAIDHITAMQGNDASTWEWGKAHQLTLRHPLASVDALNRAFRLNRGPYAVGGSYHTVSPFSFRWGRPDSVYHGSSHRNIYDLADWDQSLSILPTGTSGIPASENYCDQTSSYLQGRYYKDPFSESEVASAAKHRAIYFP